MAIEIAVVSYLKSVTAIADLIEDRISWFYAPPVSDYPFPPYVVGFRTSGENQPAQMRTQTGADTMFFLFDLHVIGCTPEATKNVAEAIRKNLIRLQGTQEGYVIQDTYYEGEDDIAEAVIEGGADFLCETISHWRMPYLE